MLQTGKLDPLMTVLAMSTNAVNKIDNEIGPRGALLISSTSRTFHGASRKARATKIVHEFRRSA